MKAYKTWRESLVDWQKESGIEVFFHFGNYSTYFGDHKCKGIVATINDESRAGSSQFYLGEVLDYNDNFLLWQNDVYYSVLNRKTGELVTMNLEDDESSVDDEENPINQIWELVK